MLLPQKLTFSIACLLLLTLSTTTTIGQSKKQAKPLVEHSSGLDPYPVYKASHKNSFIDSIIYNGPFITFYVSFEKPTSDGHYLFESISSNHGWTCETAAGICHPVLIKDIRKNGQLISKQTKETPLDLIFRDATIPMTRISCAFQFFREDFIHGEAILRESLVKNYSDQTSPYLEFKGIRIRTKNFPKAISKAYKEDFLWTRDDALKKMICTLNEVPVPISLQRIVTTIPPSHALTPNYKVLPSGQNQLFLKGVWHTQTATIFRIQYYAPQSTYAFVNLYNKGKQKYHILAGSKKFKMRSIQNVLVNQYLIKERINDKENLRLEKSPCLYLLTYDVYFDRLPNDLSTFDLIEGKPKEDVTPFDFYNVELNPASE